MANQIVKMSDGSYCELIKFLGEGGQGRVFLVTNSKQKGKQFALKIFKEEPRYAPNSPFIKNIKNNILLGSPSAKFVWPILMTEPLGKNKNKIGYMMDLVDYKKYSKFAHLLKGIKKPKNQLVFIKLMDELVSAFEILHSRGFSYQDLNHGGVVFDCENGNVLICDCDNITYNGYNYGIQGMFKYMAPEVAGNMYVPDTYSDRYSLAVLLFMYLTHSHPLEGANKEKYPIINKKAENDLYIRNPIFVHHPKNSTNRQNSKTHLDCIKAWENLPQGIKDCFIKTFTVGCPPVTGDLTNVKRGRQLRTTEAEWRRQLHTWHNNSIGCEYCGTGTFVDVVGGKILPKQCPHCKKMINTRLPVLEIKRNGVVKVEVVLQFGKDITERQLFDVATYNVVGSVLKNPANNALGIVNKSNTIWSAHTKTDPKVVPFEKGKVLPCIDGLQIKFNATMTGEITFR